MHSIRLQNQFAAWCFLALAMTWFVDQAIKRYTKHAVTGCVVQRIARRAGGRSRKMMVRRRRMKMLKAETVMLACAFAWCVLFYLTLGRR